MIIHIRARDCGVFRSWRWASAFGLWPPSATHLTAADSSDRARTPQPAFYESIQGSAASAEGLGGAACEIEFDVTTHHVPTAITNFFGLHPTTAERGPTTSRRPKFAARL